MGISLVTSEGARMLFGLPNMQAQRELLASSDRKVFS